MKPFSSPTFHRIVQASLAILTVAALVVGQVLDATFGTGIWTKWLL